MLDRQSWGIFIFRLATSETIMSDYNWLQVTSDYKQLQPTL